MRRPWEACNPPEPQAFQVVLFKSTFHFILQFLTFYGLFLFFSRRRNAVKVLFFTGDGLAIFYRRLERGTFELPSVAASADAKGIELKLSELTLILEGIELASVKHRKRWSAKKSAT